MTIPLVKFAHHVQTFKNLITYGTKANGRAIGSGIRLNLLKFFYDHFIIAHNFSFSLKMVIQPTMSAIHW